MHSALFLTGLCFTISRTFLVFPSSIPKIVVLTCNKHTDGVVSGAAAHFRRRQHTPETCRQDIRPDGQEPRRQAHAGRVPGRKQSGPPDCTSAVPRRHHTRSSTAEGAAPGVRGGHVTISRVERLSQTHWTLHPSDVDCVLCVCVGFRDRSPLLSSGLPIAPLSVNPSVILMVHLGQLSVLLITL